MPIDLNARVLLPKHMGGTQICEMNIGRYNNYDAAQAELKAARADTPAIVNKVVSALYAHFYGGSKAPIVEYTAGL